MTDELEIDEIDEGALDAPVESHARKTGPGQWILAGLGAAVLLLALTLVFSKDKSPQAAPDSQANADKSAYHLVLREMRTGVRLARLNDFIATYPDSRYATTARAQHASLKAEEDSAWSQLTDKLFDLEAEPENRQAAIEAYQSEWGTWVRAEQLQNLTAEAPEDDGTGFKPITKKSKFAKGGLDSGLVGAPQPKRRAMVIPPPEFDEVERLPRAVDARIRKRKRPVYPRKAKRRNIGATVTLSLDIDHRGRVVDTHVVSVEARRYSKDFVKAAKRAAVRTRFYPKTVGGRPVGTRGFVQKYLFQPDG